MKRIEGRIDIATVHGTCRGDVLVNIIDESHPDIIYYDEIECRLYNELPNI